MRTPARRRRAAARRAAARAWAGVPSTPRSADERGASPPSSPVGDDERDGRAGADRRTHDAARERPQLGGGDVVDVADEHAAPAARGQTPVLEAGDEQLGDVALERGTSSGLADRRSSAAVSSGSASRLGDVAGAAAASLRPRRARRSRRSP
jgi:hypothetical protein